MDNYLSPPVCARLFALMIKAFCITALWFIAGAAFAAPLPAHAQEGAVPQPAAPVTAPAQPRVIYDEMSLLGEDEATEPALSLSPDKSQIIHLKRDASAVFVGNPTHLGVLMDSPTTLVLIPRQPGATHFIVLDRNQKVITQRHVLIGGPQKNYIRVRRACAMGSGNSGTNCQPTSVFYCPDVCHEVSLPQAAPAPVDGRSEINATPPAPEPLPAADGRELSAPQ